MKLKLNNSTRKKTSERCNLSNSKSQSKQYKVIKDMELVRNKIDQHLAISYRKFNLDSLANTNNNHQVTKINGKEIIGIINLKRRKNVSSNQQYHKFPQNEEAQEIVLISNQEVKQYIQLVYQIYNIKDPLSCQANEKESQKTESTIQKDKAKIQLCFDQINSARTTKGHTESIAEVSQFNIDQQKTARNTIKRNNKIVITLRSKTATKQYQKRTNPLMNRNLSNNIKTHFNSMPNQELPLYRYCFACEQPIYQKNIALHESKCSKLKLAYTFSFQKILEVLDQKIQNIKGDINRKILQVSPQEISCQFKQFQIGIKKWISLVPSKGHLKQQKQRRKPQPLKNQYLKVKQKMRWNQNLQLLSKLDWFARLRQNIFSYSYAAQQRP